MQELLILDYASVNTLKPEIKSKLTVVQEIPPRMMVVEGDPAEIRSAVNLPGVHTSAEMSPSDQLSYPEQLFFDAWRQNSSLKKKRKFQGFNWGTKGFSSP